MFHFEFADMLKDCGFLDFSLHAAQETGRSLPPQCVFILNNFHFVVTVSNRELPVCDVALHFTGAKVKVFCHPAPKSNSPC